MGKLLTSRRRLLIAAPAICLAATIKPKKLRAQGNGYQPPDWQKDRAPDDVIVRFIPGVRPSNPAIKQILDHYKATQVNMWPGVRAYMFRVEPGGDAEGLAQALDASGLVEEAHPNHKGKATLVSPNDPYFTGTSGTQYEIAMCDVQTAWTYLTLNGNAHVPVYDLNSGILYTHEEFNSVGFGTPLLGGFNTFTLATGVTSCPASGTTFHGNKCGGLIAAQTNNGLGVSTVGYGGSVFPILCWTDDSAIVISQFYTAWQWLLNNATAPAIVNMSVTFAGWNQTADDYLTQLWNNGFLLFAATGDGAVYGTLPVTECATGPCNNSYVIGVTGVNSAYQLPAFTPNYGPAQTWTNSRGFLVNNQPGGIISAPSGYGNTLWVLGDTNNAYAGGAYGTSLSSPWACGAAQLVWEANLRMKNYDMFHLIVEAGLGINVSGYTGVSAPWNNPQCMNVGALVSAAMSYRGLPYAGRSLRNGGRL